MEFLIYPAGCIKNVLHFDRLKCISFTTTQYEKYTNKRLVT